MSDRHQKADGCDVSTDNPQEPRFASLPWRHRRRQAQRSADRRIRQAADELAGAERRIVGAAIDGSNDAAAEAAASDELSDEATQTIGPEGPVEADPDGPSDSEVAKPDGSLPSYLQGESSEADLECDVAELEAGIDGDAPTKRRCSRSYAAAPLPAS